MSARSYLSIGDVLTLLRQEFPDVTISKIRFLESQGLVNPERTPSGYRKFYEHDVERLRWVLRQQREHFLPLKVIKDRLDDDGGGSESGAAATAASPAPAYPESKEVTEAADSAELGAHHAEEPVLVGQRLSADSSGQQAVGRSQGERPTMRTVGGPTLPGIESSTGPIAPVGSIPTAGRGTSSASSMQRPTASPTGPSTPTSAGTAPSSGHAGSSPTRLQAVEPSQGREASAGPDQSGAVLSSSTKDPESSGTPGDQAAAGSPAKPAPRAPAGGAARQQRRPKAAPAVDSASATDAGGSVEAPTGSNGTNMSVDELSASSGLDPAVLAELQEYGLLASTMIAGLEYYDEEGLAVATAAARFAQFGIEPRHLRLYKNAADREAGFIEQIVLPLVRQRNPEARARARETVDELAGLGEQLRSALLRIALRDTLGD